MHERLDANRTVRVGERIRVNGWVKVVAVKDGEAVLAVEPVARSVRVRNKRRRFDKDGR